MDKYTVRFSKDGSVDVNASVNAYASVLTKWIDENEIPVADVEAAVDSVFDEQGSDKPLPKTALIAYATTALKPAHSKITSAQTRIEAFLRGSPRFYAIKGKNGGYRRICRVGEEDQQQASAATGT